MSIVYLRSRLCKEYVLYANLLVKLIFNTYSTILNNIHALPIPHLYYTILLHTHIQVVNSNYHEKEAESYELRVRREQFLRDSAEAEREEAVEVCALRGICMLYILFICIVVHYSNDDNIVMYVLKGTYTLYYLYTSVYTPFFCYNA